MRLFSRYPILRTVIVHITTGKAIKGVLWRERRRYLLLRQAELLAPGERGVAMDGEVLVPAERVEWLQIVAEREP